MAHNLSRTSLRSNTAVNRTTESRSTDFYHRTSPWTPAVLSPADFLTPLSDPAAPQTELSASQPPFTRIWLELSVISTKESSG